LEDLLEGSDVRRLVIDDEKGRCVGQDRYRRRSDISRGRFVKHAFTLSLVQHNVN
jgi:hypothetical protein